MYEPYTISYYRSTTFGLTVTLKSTQHIHCMSKHDINPFNTYQQG